MDDLQAIHRLKKGEIGGLGALIDRYQTPALRTAFLITQDTAIAQDVVQDAFLNAYRSIHQFDIRRPFAPWLMRSVANGALKALRGRSSVVSIDHADEDDPASAEWLADSAALPDEIVETEFTAQIVRDAIAALSPERRAVLVLRLYLDLSEAETANTLGIPVGTVKSRLHAAKMQVRTLIRDAATMQEE